MTEPYNPWDPRPATSATLTAERAEKTDHWIRMTVTLEIDVPPGPTPDDVARAIHADGIVLPGLDRPATIRSTVVDRPFDTHFHSIDRIATLREKELPDLLGHPIWWTVKEDGACLGCTLNEDGVVHLHTRESPDAAPLVYRQFHETGVATNVGILLEELDRTRGGAVVFGEILAKGSSPQKVQVYDRHQFVVFDILTVRDGYLPYPEVAKYAEGHGIPVVGTFGTTTHTTLDSLLATRDRLVALMQAKSKEGVVGKVWRHDGDPRPIFFKEKWKAPRGARKAAADRPEKPVLPDLPEDEIRGAVEKARCEIGEDFFEIRTAMPVVARYVKIEADKHGCAVPGNVIDYYRERCESLRCR